MGCRKVVRYSQPLRKSIVAIYIQQQSNCGSSQMSCLLLCATLTSGNLVVHIHVGICIPLVVKSLHVECIYLIINTRAAWWQI